MDIQSHVTQVIAELTRYPLEILTRDADFEADLGIDSVKRVEIFGRLQRHYGLDESVPVPIRALRTIANVVTFIEQSRNGTAPAPAPAPAPALKPVVAKKENGLSWAMQAKPKTNGHPTPDLEGRMMEVFRSVLDETLRRTNGAVPKAAAPQKRGPTFARADFEGRVVLVTGSGRGLGRQLALRLGTLGARVLVNSFHSRDLGEATTAEIKAAGGDATHLWGSVANEEHVKRMFGEIETQFGGLDMFVSNASNGHLGPLAEVTSAHWQLAFQTNVIAFHQASLLAAPLMERRGGGHIVALSSPGADRIVEHFGCLGPVKAALESLVRYLAVELGPRGIQVNALSAGALDGDLLRKYPDADRLMPYWAARNATGRLTPEEGVVDHLLFLLIAPNISGSTVVVDDAGTIQV